MQKLLLGKCGFLILKNGAYSIFSNEEEKE